MNSYCKHEALMAPIRKKILSISITYVFIVLVPWMKIKKFQVTLFLKRNCWQRQIPKGSLFHNRKTGKLSPQVLCFISTFLKVLFARCSLLAFQATLSLKRNYWWWQRKILKRSLFHNRNTGKLSPRSSIALLAFLRMLFARCSCLTFQATLSLKIRWQRRLPKRCFLDLSFIMSL